MVDNGITRYVDIAVAGTVTLTNDGAVSLSLTNGDASATNIVSSLTGAGTVSAQFAIIKVTGTLTTAKVLTPPSSSRTYVVVNAATGSTVTVKAATQPGVSIAVGETAFVYFNGTDYVKVAGTVNTGVTSFQTSLSGLTPSTSTTGAVTLAGTLGTANGGTNLTSFTSGGVVYASGTGTLATGSALTYNGTSLSIGVSPSSATSKLNVSVGNVSTLGAPASSGLSIDSNDNNIVVGNISQLSFGLRNDFQPSYISHVVTSAAGYSNGALVFGTRSATTDTAPSERMRITSAGDVGIGTSSPSSKLDVVGTLTSTGTTASAYFSSGNPVQGANNPTFSMKVANSNGGFLNWYNSSGTPTWGWYSYMGASGQQGNLTVRDWVGAVNVLDITPAGNVGIGTTTPLGRLDSSYNITSYEGGQLVASNIAKTNYASITAVNGQTFTTIQTYNSSTAAGALILQPSAGNVGIGLTNPGYKLQVAGSSNQISIQNTGYGAYLFDVTSGVALAFTKEGTGERARISPNGGFSVGTTADPGAGAIYATGNITAYYSDARLKTVSGKIENALDKVAQLSGVYYTNNETAKSFGYDSDEVQVGVLAQDVEAVLPQIVKAAPFDLDQDGNSKSGENYKTVQYERLVPLLIEAINELRAEVKALKGE
jgi:hypothetical protein